MNKLTALLMAPPADLSTIEVVVMGNILARTGDEDTAIFDHAEVAKNLNATERTIVRALKGLKDKGYIAIQRKYNHPDVITVISQ